MTDPLIVANELHAWNLASKAKFIERQIEMEKTVKQRIEEANERERNATGVYGIQNELSIAEEGKASRAAQPKREMVFLMYRKTKDEIGLCGKDGYLYFLLDDKFESAEGVKLLPDPTKVGINDTAGHMDQVMITYIPKQRKLNAYCTLLKVELYVDTSMPEIAPSKPTKPAKADKNTREPRTREWSAKKTNAANVEYMITGHMNYWMQDVVGMKSYRLSMTDLKESLRTTGIKATCDNLDCVIDKALADKARDVQMEVLPALSPEAIVRCPDCASTDLGICEIVYENVKYQIVCLTCGTITNPNGKVIPYEMYHSVPTEKQEEPMPTKQATAPVVDESEVRAQVTSVYRTVMNINDHAFNTDEQTDMIAMFKEFSHGRSIAQCIEDKDLTYGCDNWQSFVENKHEFRTFDQEPPNPELTAAPEFDNTPSPDADAAAVAYAVDSATLNAQTITSDGEIIPQETYAATAGTDKLVPSVLLAEIKTMTGIPVGEIGTYLNRSHPDKPGKSAYKNIKGPGGAKWTDLDPVAVRIRFEKVFGPLGFGYRIVPIPGLGTVTYTKETRVGTNGSPYDVTVATAIGFIFEYALVTPNGDVVWNQTSAMSDSCEMNGNDIGHVMRGVYTSLTKQALRNFGGFDHFAKNF